MQDQAIVFLILANTTVHPFTILGIIQQLSILRHITNKTYLEKQIQWH